MATEPRLAVDREVVHPGDRLGFEAHPKRDGHLLVLGIDANGETYPCFPQNSQESRSVDAWPEARPLDSAVELDTKKGQERIVALLCSEPLDFEDAGRALKAANESTTVESPLPDLGLDCIQRELRLYKSRDE